MKNRLLLSILLLPSLLFTSCSSSSIKVDPNKEIYKVGITQLVPHIALDAATSGFKDALKIKLAQEDRKVEFIETNAQGEISLCNVNATALLSHNVDLILANATAPFQAMVHATNNVPILGTSITSYEAALGRTIENDLIGNNVSGTSDLAPLNEQAQMIFDIVDEVKTIGILYCSAETNSVFQVKKIKEEINKIASRDKKEITIKEYGFLVSNDVEQIARLASKECDALYTPTDNVIASCGQTIAAATKHGKNGKRTPIIAGEEGACKSMGLATLTISYYDLGYQTGEMAFNILLAKENITKMKIEYSKKFVKKYNEKFALECGINIAEKFENYAKLD